MYKIEFDEKARVLTLWRSGFWDVAVVEKYCADVNAKLAELRARHARFGILSDNREFPVQSMEVIKAFEPLSSSILKYWQYGRVALVMKQMLGKLQAERIGSAEHVRVFFDEQEARAWLAEDDAWHQEV